MKHNYSTLALAMVLAMPVTAQTNKTVWQPKHIVTERHTESYWLDKQTIINTITEETRTFNEWGYLASVLTVEKGATIGKYILYKYNDKGHLIEMKEQKYDVATKTCTDNILFSYILDDNGRRTQALQQSYNPETGKYENRSLDKNIFTNEYVNGTDKSEHYIWDANTESWILMSGNLTTNLYNSSGKPTLRRYEDLDNNGEAIYTTDCQVQYSADGLPTEYVEKTTILNTYKEVPDKDIRQSVYDNFLFPTYNVDFSKQNEWWGLGQVLGDNYQCDLTISTWIENGNNKTDPSTNSYKISLTTGKQNELPYSIKVEDQRSESGMYWYTETIQTDEYGSETKSTKTYKELAADEDPKDEKLKNIIKIKKSVTPEGDYTTESYVTADENDPTSLRLSNYNWNKSVRNAEHGYIEKLEYGSTNYDENSNINYKSKTTITYSDYQEIVLNSIYNVKANANNIQPRRVYNVSGIYLGTSTDNLPSGLYIVREGGRSYKVMK